MAGTEICKTSSCFVQWHDGVEERGGRGEEREGEGEEKKEKEAMIEGSVWGLNFMSEEDAMKFLKGCTVSQ